MSFTFTPKTASGFTLPTTTTGATGGFQFGAAGDAKITKPATTLTFTPSLTMVSTAASTSAPGFSLTNTSAAPGFGFPSTTASTGFSLTSTSTPAAFNLTSTTTTASSMPQFSLGSLASTTTGSTSLSFSLSTTTAPSLSNVSTPSVPTTTVGAVTSSVFSLTGSTLPKPATTSITTANTAISTTSVTTPALTTTTSSLTSGTTSSTLTCAQIEEFINKWTISLEEERKHFSNQAKQMNAWDRLLMTNGEKIMCLSSGIERVKQLQEQLDQELDFVIAQQKELVDLISPLEKELADIPITDMDRHRTYQMAETLDTELKQMSEDLKEVIEHLNETNKYQELANPMYQIGSILNVHMNSLQWIDRQITKITTHLDQISKMHDMNKRKHEINLQKTYV